MISFYADIRRTLPIYFILQFRYRIRHGFFIILSSFQSFTKSTDPSVKVRKICRNYSWSFQRNFGGRELKISNVYGDVDKNFYLVRYGSKFSTYTIIDQRAVFRRKEGNISFHFVAKQLDMRYSRISKYIMTKS